MRGEFIGVWAEMWWEVWLPLIDQPLREGEDGVPEDIFCELYREVARALKAQPSIEALADVIDDPVQSREAFEKTTAADLTGERAVVTFLEAAHPALDDLCGDELTNRYFNLLSGFVDKFSLRYDLRRRLRALYPTLPGLFASLVRDLRALASQDLHLDQLHMKEYRGGGDETCGFDGCTDAPDQDVHPASRFMLLEAIGRTRSRRHKETRWATMCDQSGQLVAARDDLKAALKKLHWLRLGLSGHPTRRPRRSGRSAPDRDA